MTFEKKLRELANEQLPFDLIELAKVSDEVIAKVFGEPEFKQDKQNNDCCFITLIFEGEKQGIIQKYTKTNWKQLNETINASGGISELQKNFHTWKKQTIGRSQYARLFPTPNQKRK